QARALRARARPELCVHSSVRATALPVDQPLSLPQRSASRFRLLDRHRLYLAVLGIPLCLQEDRRPPTLGIDLRRIACVYLAVRILFLWRRELAVPAVADHQSAARLLLSFRAAAGRSRPLHMRHCRLRAGLSVVGLSRAAIA